MAAKDSATLDVATIRVEEALVKEEAALAALPPEALAALTIVALSATIVEVVLVEVGEEEEKVHFQVALDPTPALVLEHLADDIVIVKSTLRLEKHFL